MSGFSIAGYHRGLDISPGFLFLFDGREKKRFRAHS